MAIKHKAELGLDPVSAEIIVLRRLIEGDYAIDEVEELSLTVRHALKLFSGYLRSGVDYYLRLSPESGTITASRTEDEFCGPIIAKLSLSVRGYGSVVRQDINVACDSCDYCEDDPVRCDQGCDKSLRLDEEKGRLIIFYVNGETTLLDLVQNTVDTISNYTKANARGDDPRWSL